MKKHVWYVQWFYDFVSICILGSMMFGFMYLTLHAIVKTQELSMFRRGVECSVYWQDTKCGPRYQQVYAEQNHREPAIIQ